MQVCLDGNFMDAHDPAFLSVVERNDPAVFTTTRTYGDRVFALDRHLDRLLESAQIMNITLPPLVKHVLGCDRGGGARGGLESYLEHCTLPLRLRLTLTSDHWWLESWPLEDHSSMREQGVIVTDTTLERESPTAKYCTPRYQQIQNQQDDNVFETLFFDANDNLLEGNITNVFAVFGNEIATPDEGILPGIMRETVLNLFVVGAENVQPLRVQLRTISRLQLQTADEIFLTNCIRGIIPVRQWGEWQCDEFPITKKLRQIFLENIMSV